jgi:hypothetical protein
MKKKVHLTALTLMLLLILAIQPSVSGYVQVGVKKGSWIEYQVAVTGTPPKEHDAQWARMEVVNVKNTSVSLNVTTQFKNGTYLYENVTLDLQSGNLGDDFFIPANLTPGEQFYDLHNGNITINTTQIRTYDYTERTVVTANTSNTTYYWDQETGILLEANSTYPDQNFTIITIADKTNLWPPKMSPMETGTVYAISGGIVITVLAVMLLSCTKKKPTQGKE